MNHKLLYDNIKLYYIIIIEYKYIQCESGLFSTNEITALSYNDVLMNLELIMD